MRAQPAGMGDVLGAGIGTGLLLGPAGAALGTLAAAAHADTVNRTASADYLAKRFHPWLFPPGAKGGGGVFFAGAPQSLTTLAFTVRGMESGREQQLSVALRAVAP